MNRISSLLKSFAVKNWQKYSFKKEWAGVIVLMLVLKLATSAVSIFSGWFYLVNFFYSFTDSEIASRLFSGVALVLVEGLCALFLAKFFKFALRCEFVTASLPLLCAGLVFAISFVISTNGIALYTTKSEDLSKEINDKFNLQVATAQKQYDADNAEITRYIETQKANPQGWSNGKRCMLSQFQAEEIAKAYDNMNGNKIALNQKLQDIERQRNVALSENAKKTTDTADRYYSIVAFIMLIQVICSGGLWFFWSKIAAQDAPENDKREAIEDIYTKTVTTIDKGIDNCVTAKLSQMQTVFAQLNNDYQVKQLIAAYPSQPTAMPKRAGFSIPETPQTPPEISPKTPEKTPETETNYNAATVAVSAVNNAVNNAICEHCGKPLTQSQIVRRAKYCSPRCRVAAYNGRNPDRKQIVIATQSLKD